MRIQLNTCRTLIIMIAAVLLFSARPGFTQSFIDRDSSHVVPRVYASIGGYFPTITTSLRVDSDLGFGTDISLEDDFKMPATMSVFKADVFYRVKNRSQFALSFTSMRRDKNIKIDKDISFADTTFSIDSEITAWFNTNYYGLTWMYSVWNKPGWQAGFSVGLRALAIDAGIRARFNDRNYEKSSEVLAPALLVGVHGAGYITDRFLARYSMEYFQLSVEGIKIVVLENKFSLDYYIVRNLGIGVGYSTSIYNVKEIPFDSDFKGRVRFGFAGFQAQLSARF